MTPRTFINLARAQRNADRAARRADAWAAIVYTIIPSMVAFIYGVWL